MRKLFTLILCLMFINPVFAFSFDLDGFSLMKEKFILTFTFDESKKAEKMTDFAEHRLEKINETKNENQKSKLMSEYQSYIKSAKTIAQKNNNSNLMDRIQTIGSVASRFDKNPTIENYSIPEKFNRSIDERIQSKRPVDRLPRVNIGSIGKEDEDITHIDIKRPDNTFCIQVIQPAINPITGECKQFSTPCDVPVDWEKVHSCNDPGNSDISKTNRKDLNGNVNRINPRGTIESII